MFKSTVYDYGVLVSSGSSDVNCRNVTNNQYLVVRHNA